jgi:hypothetical protein
MFAVWQATHDGPDSYLPNGKENIQSDGTAGYGEDVPLWPFRCGPTKDDFWTSAMAKETDTFGYTYSDTQHGKDEIILRWNQSYRWSLQSNDLVHPPEGMGPVDVSNAQALRCTDDDDNPRRIESMQEIQEPDVEELTLSAVPDWEVRNVQGLLTNTQGIDSVELDVQWYIDTQVERYAVSIPHVKIAELTRVA